MGDQQVTNTSAMGTDIKGAAVSDVPVKQKDAMDEVALQLKDATADAIYMIKAGQAPQPYFFGFEPQNPQSNEARHSFESLLGASSIARMFSAMNTVAARKSRNQADEPYTLRNPAQFICAINEGTDAVFKALTAGPLTSMYEKANSGSTQTEEPLLKRTELHDFVIPRIFGGLRPISKQHMEKLDGILTAFTSALRSFKVGLPGDSSPSPAEDQLKFAVVIHYIKATDITGDGSLLIHEAMTRLVHISVLAQDWAHALDKPSKLDLRRRNEKIRFKMTTTSIEMRLDENKYRAAKPKFEQALRMMVDSDLEMTKMVEDGGLLAYGRETCSVFDAQVPES